MTADFLLEAPPRDKDAAYQRKIRDQEAVQEQAVFTEFDSLPESPQTTSRSGSNSSENPPTSPLNGTVSP